MNIANLLFSFEGRLRRLHYWLTFIVLMIISGIVASVTYVPALVAASGTGDSSAIMAAMASPGALIYWAYCLVLIWPNLALQVKRCHDRNRSGLFVLIVFIPIIGAIWFLIEQLFIDGTPGPNRFGPSPKGLGGPAPLEGAVVQ